MRDRRIHPTLVRLGRGDVVGQRRHAAADFVGKFDQRAVGSDVDAVVTGGVEEHGLAVGPKIQTNRNI